MNDFELPEIEVEAGVSTETIVASVVAILVTAAVIILMIKLARG